jgi:uncharacterized protein YbjT (DUF2867 family)
VVGEVQAVDVALVAARVQVLHLLVTRLRAPNLTAKRRAKVDNLIRCAQALTASRDVVETQMAAAQAVTAVEAAPVVLVAQVVAVEVLEVTQMAIHSVDHVAAQAQAGVRAGTAAPAMVLIAGATGLVGKELLALLLASPACREVHSLVRKPSSLKHAKLQSHVVDFAELGTASAQALSLPALDEVYICLGTTIKVAGSQAAFRAVDFDAVLAVARAGIARGATKIGVISAMGASSSSGVFYSRVKGEMEEAVAKLGYQSVSIARPSFLAGDREALQQNTRSGEKIALVAMTMFSSLIPKNYQAVQASDVAAGLYAQVQRSKAGTTVLLSGQLQSA